MDTTVTVMDDDAAGLHIDARLSAAYDLRRNLFQDVGVWFPRFIIPRDTVFVNHYTQETVYKLVKPSKWGYVKAGIVGAALGLTVYAVAQGL
jgi:hypothetical protein